MGRDSAHRAATPLLTAALLAAAISAATVTVALTFFADRAHDPAGPTAPITAATSVTPQQHLFGDRVSARVAVRVRAEFVDPRTVAIEQNFVPYTVLGRPRLRRRGDSIVFAASLVCLARACAPRAPQRVRTFPPALVHFGEGRRRLTLVEPWPAMLVASRLTPGDLRRPALLTRLDPPAEPSPDRTLGWWLAGAATLLFLAAGAPAALRLFGGARNPGATRTGFDELEHALAEVRRLARDGDEARRSALDRLAAALARSGVDAGAPQARSLAWSRRPPAAEAMRRLLSSIEQRIGGTM